ncbi:MAG: Dna2/Cas4 domain-containing protein, partial [Candidatus Parvarchaeota archaeon]
MDSISGFTGTQVNYYFVCKRKLWFFSHNIELESDSDLVLMGR